jgi:ketosteroid isomerase-like protein
VAGDFDDLVAAERAFAADASARGNRAAFLEAHANDGLVFAPGPTNGKAVWDARKANKDRLEWAPELAEIAGSGDLGYTTGPWRLTPEGAEKPTAFGHYFTIWRKAADGKWKVVLDHGIGHQEVALPENGAAARWPGARRAADLDSRQCRTAQR